MASSPRRTSSWLPPSLSHCPLSRIEISSAAAVGEAQKIMSEKINEAYKEGQRDAQRFLKEMRSFFP